MFRILFFLGLCGSLCAGTPAPDATPSAVASIEPAELEGFDGNPPLVRELLDHCLALTKQNLAYRFGSSDPAQGGMDCSGTIYFVLQAVGIKDVPRTSSKQYVWARKADNFESVISRNKDSFELDALRPGDLLFWTGTYSTERDPPVTHSMIYLGKRKADGKQVMFGASDGRSYDGKKIWGVSVFDFTIPKARKKPVPGEPSAPGSVFIGYARIPGLESAAP
ncbi:MAG: C40 family peptidase [Terrimicrobiaceae bacterium]